LKFGVIDNGCRYIHKTLGMLNRVAEVDEYPNLFVSEV